MPKVTFDNRDNAFFISLKTSVDAYFEQNRIRKTGDWRLYLKTILLLGSGLACYGWLMLAHPPYWVALLLCMLLGYTMACIGFGVMHDANHGSYSTKPWLNDLLGMSMNFMGASAYFWKQKHNILHHTYTNVDGLDDDIAKSPIIRQCESQRWVPAHRWQHIYLFPAYALSTVFWVFIMDFKKYFSGMIYTTRAWKMSPKNHIIFWATKCFYIAAYMVLPALVWGFGPWLLGYLITMSTMGLTLSIVFQLAHVVENTEFEHVPLDTTKHIDTAWAEHELRTTSNFSMNNPVLSWFVGGLNFQIEHHLFPKISHVHYPAISKIVMAKCREFNLPYNKYDSFPEAFRSHLRVMYQLGRSAESPIKNHMRGARLEAA